MATKAIVHYSSAIKYEYLIDRLRFSLLRSSLALTGHVKFGSESANRFLSLDGLCTVPLLGIGYKLQVSSSCRTGLLTVKCVHVQMCGQWHAGAL
jgi:hypothetical protein